MTKVLATLCLIVSIGCGLSTLLLGGLFYESGNLMGASNHLSLVGGVELFLFSFLASFGLTSSISFIITYICSMVGVKDE